MTGATAGRLLCLVGMVAGCARMGAPPGGPPDFRAPVLMSTTPDTLAVVPDFDGWVSFDFDEIVSEGGTPNFGTGRGALEQLVMISPDSGVPRVRWRRSRIEVQPRTGWQPNTVYRIEIVPGLTDLSRNDVEEPVVLTFTTGAPRPTRFLTGRAVDWVGRRFIPRALVVATFVDDSIVYRTIADSTGRFRFGPLPDGDVLVSASLEEGQPDRRLNRSREAWDTVRVGGLGETVGEIWAFVRDTLPPTMGQGGATRPDSFSIALTLNQPIDPELRLGPEAVSIYLAPDSTPIPAITALPSVIHDSIYEPIDSARRAQAAIIRESARADSVRRARADSLGITVETLDSIVADSMANAPPPAARPEREPPPAVAPDTTTRDEPLADRPPLGTRLVIRVNGVIQPGSRYLIEVRGIRAMGGAIADTLRTQLITPEAPKPVAVDSTAADSTVADSTPPPPTVGDSSGTPPSVERTPASLPSPPSPAPTNASPRAAHAARPW